MKIHVTGNAGAGKTTLANTIGQALNLPVYGLDQVVWQPSWQKTPPEERDRLEQALIEKPNWVIEGVSHQIRHAADLTLFLDVPRLRCLRRALIRSLPHLFSGRPELPENCPEYQILPQLVKIIWGFEDRVKPIIIEEINAGIKVIQLSQLSQPDLKGNVDELVTLIQDWFAAEPV